MYIIYLMYEDKQVPIACETVEDDPLLSGHYLLKGVRGLTDNAYPKIEIHSLSTAKENVNYYVMGDEKEEAEIEEEPIPASPEVIEEKKVTKKGRKKRRIKE
tara:strand:- start:356 stop:661 length:306 start_codon:yes stop_codon:yes gene_type:complete